MTALTLPMASRDKTDAIKSFFHLEKGKTSLDLSGANLICVMDEYENHARAYHPGYSNRSARNKVYDLSQYVQANIMPWRVDEDFYMMFFTYCRQICSPALNPSTIENYCTLIRVALTWGMRHKVEVSDTYDQFEIPDKINKVKVSLSQDQISQIYHFNFVTWNAAQPKGHRLRKDLIATLGRVRDQFVLGCLLGQRYSDMRRIIPEWFNENKTIMKVPCQQKTGNQAVVDIKTLSAHPKVAYEILEKYNYNAPYPYDITDFNNYLHRLMQIIGAPFTTMIIHDEYKQGDKLVTEDHYLWEKIASHTARRTFITLNVLKGLSEYAIRKASGHRDSKSFARYICEMDD